MPESKGPVPKVLSAKAKELITALAEETGKHVFLISESWMASDRVHRAIMLAGSLAEGVASGAVEWGLGNVSADGCRDDLARICGMTGMLHPERCPLAKDQVEKALGYLRKSFDLEAPDRDVAIEFVQWAKAAAQ